MIRLATLSVVTLVALLGAAPGAGAFTVNKSKRIKGGLATASLEAKCPKGTRATGGGFRETAPNTTTLGIVYESRKIGQRTWRVSAQILDKGAATGRIRVTAAAYCAPGAPRTTERSASVTIPGAQQIRSVAASCPAGKQAIAGGFATDPPGFSGNAATRNVVMASSRKGDDGWRVKAVTGPFGAAAHTAYVYCAGRGPASVRSGKGKVRNPANAVKFNRGGARSAPCPRGQSVLAGGFKQSPIIFDINRLTLAYPFASIAKGRRWKAAAVQAGGTLKPAVTTLRAIAYCG